MHANSTVKIKGLSASGEAFSAAQKSEKNNNTSSFSALSVVHDYLLVAFVFIPLSSNIQRETNTCKYFTLLDISFLSD